MHIASNIEKEVKAMKGSIIETKPTAVKNSLAVRQSKEDVERQMQECLARLKVWQTENLMAPQGMDRFSEKKESIPKMKAGACK